MEEYGQPGDLMQLTGPDGDAGVLRCLTVGEASPDDLRRLARWFDQADAERSHDLFTAAFGLYGARHLGSPADPDEAVPEEETTAMNTSPTDGVDLVA